MLHNHLIHKLLPMYHVHVLEFHSYRYTKPLLEMTIQFKHKNLETQPQNAIYKSYGHELDTL